jgi:head-tail adaptor
MAFTDLLTMTASIQRLTSGTPATVDGYGQPVQTWTVITSSAACLVQPARRTNPAIIGPEKQTVVSTHTAFMAYSTNVLARDRMVIGANTYNILFVRNAGAQNHHLEADLIQVQP